MRVSSIMSAEPLALSRRLFLVSLPLGLAACTTTGTPQPDTRAGLPPGVSPSDVARYGAVGGEPFTVPAVDMDELKPAYMRRLVKDPTGEQPGTLVVDPHSRYLYLVQEGGMALRYGVGVGREGLEFSGRANVAYKKEWPRWTPTSDMIAREPQKYAKWSGGMAGGAENPLGARALYLFKNGKDTLYRIHGTNEPWSIGEAVSSGCIRMMNQDVIDLYRRVPNGAKVVVLPVAATS
ncbi:MULTISPECIES: L,D-transpeptidase [unclassified Xanthobacter]|uniref:L,D-transpeptidase n=1 Tax=unclassified Xanthobacter TaxID=2623496 RepID=UPI0030808AE1